MKKFVSFMLACAVLAVVMIGCQSYSAKASKEYDPMNVTYKVSYFRTNGDVPGAEYPKTTVIEKTNQLEEYYTKNKDLYDFEYQTDTEPSFRKAIEAYDEVFFKKNSLIVVLLEENTGSARHSIQKVQADRDRIEIAIKRTVPEIRTEDMAQWHIVFEVEKAALGDKEIKVSVG